MAAFTDATENSLLNYMFGQTSYTPPATWYVGLFTAAPTDAGGGTEVSGGGYARVALSNNTTVFPVTTTAEKTLASSASFPEATANWGTIVAVGYFTASTGGVLAAWAPVSPSIQINQADIARIPAGSPGLNVTLD